MSETTNLKLFKNDNPETNNNLFDVTKSLNENWDKIDKYVYEQEAERQANENIRIENENNRKTAENIRVETEKTRDTTEKSRISAENTRKNQEATRQNAEIAREEYITNLKERVEAGEFKGEPNTLKIGTVTKGTNASATITGDSPNQTLNLVLPKGDKGDKGEQGTFPNQSIYYLAVSEEITSNTEFTIPCYYKVGANVLDVYFCGEKLIKKTTFTDGHYSEVGNANANSNKLKLEGWNAEVGTDDDLEYFEFVVRR